jgi:hypothetical protein
VWFFYDKILKTQGGDLVAHFTSTKNILIISRFQNVLFRGRT